MELSEQYLRDELELQINNVIDEFFTECFPNIIGSTRDKITDAALQACLDDIENQVDEIDGYSEMHPAFKDDIQIIDQKLIDMKVIFDDAQRSQAAGVQNVYDKFIELEKRQFKIEQLLETDSFKNIINFIIDRENIFKLFGK